MARNISQAEKNRIIELYKSGKSYRDIRNLTGASSTTISSLVKGTRTLKEAITLAKKQGKMKLTDAGRKKLSDVGKKNILRSKKCWTKPEREFKNILNDIDIGVI